MARVHAVKPSPRTHRGDATAQCRIGFQPVWAEILDVGALPGWSRLFFELCTKPRISTLSLVHKFVGQEKRRSMV
jgi:hypothetical protein